jgi:hypothetical protein
MRTITAKRKYNKDKIREIIGSDINVRDIINFFDNIFDKLEIVEYGKFTNYIIGDDIYFQDQKNGYLWVNYSRIWKILSNQYLLDTLQKKGLIQTMVEIPYGLGSLTPTEGQVWNTQG